MLSAIKKIIFVPYRFWYILLVGGFTMVSWSFRNRKSQLGRFYQDLFDKLGGTFIKAGQTLAMRQDFLPLEHCEALSDLMDKVKPFSTAKAFGMIERELGIPVDQAFAQISQSEVASASFSQVYRAKTHQGDHVAVKVKRPNMEAIVFADVFFLRFAAFLLTLFGIGRRLGVGALVNEVVSVLKEELDYDREGNYLQAFRSHCQKIDFLEVPRYFPELSTRNVLTMGFIEGTPLRQVFTSLRESPDTTLLDEEGCELDLRDIGNKIYELTMRSVFEIGFFHGDMHPGNIVIMSGGRIGLIDFGIVGILDAEMRELNFRYVSALSTGKIEEAANIYSQIVIPHPDADFLGLKKDMMLQLQVWSAAAADPEAPFIQKSSGTVLNNSVDYARKHGFYLPSNTVLYYKTVITIDHINIELNPEYDSIREAAAFIQNFRYRQMGELLSYDNVMDMMSQNLEALKNQPEALRKGLEYLKTLETNRRKSPVMMVLLEFLQLISLMLILLGLCVPIYWWLESPENMPGFLSSAAGWKIGVFSVASLFGGYRLRKLRSDIRKNIPSSG